LISSVRPEFFILIKSIEGLIELFIYKYQNEMEIALKRLKQIKK